jgi:hypothetical protein
MMSPGELARRKAERLADQVRQALDAAGIRYEAVEIGASLPDDERVREACNAAVHACQRGEGTLDEALDPFTSIPAVTIKFTNVRRADAVLAYAAREEVTS